MLVNGADCIDDDLRLARLHDHGCDGRLVGVVRAEATLSGVEVTAADVHEYCEFLWSVG